MQALPQAAAPAPPPGAYGSARGGITSILGLRRRNSAQYPSWSPGAGATTTPGAGIQLAPEDQQELANEGAGLGVAPPATSIGGYAPVTADQIGNALAGSGLSTQDAQDIYNQLYPATDTSGGDNGGGGGGGGGGYYNIYSDPGYLAAVAAYNQQIAQMNAAELAAEDRAVVDFGDPNIAGLPGFNMDPATAKLAQQNYDAGNAILARLSHSNDLARQGIINKLAASGMLDSGETGYEEGEQGRLYGNQQYDARQKLLDYFTQLQQSYQDRRNALQQAVTSALQNAYYNALAGGYGYAGGSGGGSSSGGGGGGGGGGGAAAPGGWGPSGQSADQAAINAFMQSHPSYGAPTGSATPEVMQEGQVFTGSDGRQYIRVKVGTPGGNSTEDVPL